jgi:hypothetical protein
MASEKKLFLPNIGICIFMDLFGMIPYLLPWLSFIVAPISSWTFYKLFGGRIGIIGGILDFLEEIIPFTEIIPTYTIAWFIRRIEIKNRDVRI